MTTNIQKWGNSQGIRLLFVERIPDDILDKVIDIISAEIEKVSK